MAKQHIVVLTGAGISAESGLQTFRDHDGLWMGHNVQDVATPEAFEKDPEMVLEFYNMRRREVVLAIPNAAHFGLAKLEEKYHVIIVTQNIDDLHERAGSSNVIHLHGEIFKMRSAQDEEVISEIREDILFGQLGADGHQLRPHIVWFGEAVPMIEDAAAVMSNADIFILVGTSLQVYPAAGLIHYLPPGIPKYILDRKIPSIGNLHNVLRYEMPATEGIQQILDTLI